MSKIDYKNLPHTEIVRLRPGLYIGGPDFWGLINYLVCPFNFLLSHQSTFIDIIVDGKKIVIKADALLHIESLEKGLFPFEQFRTEKGLATDIPILTALSSYLKVQATTPSKKWELQYTEGKQVAAKAVENDGAPNFVELTFSPDPTIFSVTEVSRSVFDSYFRRICHLFPQVRFTLNVPGNSTTYYSENGIRDMFEKFSSPYQLLHEPIHIQVQEGSLKLELVFAYHSWRENWIIPFINNGRAVEGGTHETGLKAAFEHLANHITSKELGNGVIAIMSIIYPDVVWEGCIKQEIRDEKLHSTIKALVIEHVGNWITKRPDIEKQLSQAKLFQFPELWYS